MSVHTSLTGSSYRLLGMLKLSIQALSLNFFTIYFVMFVCLIVLKLRNNGYFLHVNLVLKPQKPIKIT